jgi:hypothetical protein
VHINTLNRMVGMALISSALFVGMSITANGQQPPRQQAAQQQQVAPDRLPQQPQQQLTPYPQHLDQGQPVKARDTSLKKSRFLILKSVGGHIKPLPSVAAGMYPWQNRW